METLLKKILTGMIILLVVIAVGGGFYLASMGGMDHGTTAAVPDSGSVQKADTQKPGEKNDAANSGKAGVTGQQPTGQQSNGPQSGNGGQSVPPVIIQLQPPKTDPAIYIDQMKEKLRSINEINSSIASSSGGHSTTQQNSQIVTSQGDMNKLHQSFYKLGQDIAAMEQSLEKISAGIRDGQYPAPQPYSYTYPYGVSPYNNYPNANFQYPANPFYPNQSGQTVQPNQGHQPGNGSNQNGTGSGNSGHSGTNGQMSHGISLGSMLNAELAKTLFTLMLLGSVVLAIVSVIGFLASLFKKDDQNRPGISHHTST